MNWYELKWANKKGRIATVQNGDQVRSTQHLARPVDRLDGLGRVSVTQRARPLVRPSGERLGRGRSYRTRMLRCRLPLSPHGHLQVGSIVTPPARDLGIHAAALSGAREGVQGSMRSSVEISASDRPVSTSCRHPVFLKMWIAKERLGLRSPRRMKLAMVWLIPTTSTSVF